MPPVAETLKEEGNALYKAHKFADALAAWNRALTLPDVPDELGLILRQNSAIALRQLGRFEEAVKLCRSIKLPTAKVVYCHAVSLLNLQRYRQALDVLRSSGLSDDPLLSLEREVRQRRIAASRNNELEGELEGREIKTVPIWSDEGNSFQRCVLEAVKSCPAAFQNATAGKGPLCLYWIGARDEVGANVDLLVSHFNRDLAIVCVGPEANAKEMDASTTRVGPHSVRWYVRRSLYNWDTLQKLDAPMPQIFCIFCAGFDASFSAWAPGLQAVLSHKDVPVIITGYLNDQSMVQDIDFVTSLGGRVISPPRYTTCGVAVFSFVKNAHLMVATRADTFEKKSQAELADLERKFVERGFEIKM